MKLSLSTIMTPLILAAALSTQVQALDGVERPDEIYWQVSPLNPLQLQVITNAIVEKAPPLPVLPEELWLNILHRVMFSDHDRLGVNPPQSLAPVCRQWRELARDSSTQQIIKNMPTVEFDINNYPGDLLSAAIASYKAMTNIGILEVKLHRETDAYAWANAS